MKAIWCTILTLLAAVSVTSAATYRVPDNFATIEQAIEGVESGSTIYVAAGTYREYIEIMGLSKTVLVKSEAGPAATVIDGQNVRRLLRIANSELDDPNQNVVFDGFTFANGNEPGMALSPITISSAKPVFIHCVFRNNHAAEKGGAVLSYGASSAPSFIECEFKNNRSDRTGGAVLAGGAADEFISFKECLFQDNSNRTSTWSGRHNGGGAIYFAECNGLVVDCTFNNNSCNYAGGAVTSISDWQYSTKRVEIAGCTFTGNFAQPWPGQEPPEPSEAGAVMTEGNMDMVIQNCYFENNWAMGGGGVQSFRANLYIYDSIFENCRATGTGGLGAGGAISVNLNDWIPPDRREAELVVRNVVIRNGSAPVAGGIYFQGDAGYQKNGNVTLDNVTIDNCSVTTANGSYGNGGALFFAYATCNASDTYLLNNYAGQAGGALAMIQNTSLTLRDCYVVGNDAGIADAAIHNPQGLNYSAPGTVFAYNGGSPSASINKLVAHPDVSFRDQGCLTWIVSPWNGSPSINQGVGSLPRDGNFSAGTVRVGGIDANTTYTMSSPGKANRQAAIQYSGACSTLPYGGTPAAVPGWIEAEHFDAGGEGVSYHDSTPGNIPNVYRTSEDVDIAPDAGAGNGYLLGWVVPGECLEYTVDVQQDGIYDMDLYVSSPAPGGQYYIMLDGTDVSGLIDVPNTGGWTSWQAVRHRNTSLNAGWHRITLVVAAGSFTIDNMQWFLPNADPDLAVDTTVLNRTARIGKNAVAQSFNLWNAGGNSMGYTVSDNASWLSCTPTSGSSGGEVDTITVVYSTAALGAGSYNARITINAPGAANSPRQIDVNLNVIEGRLNPTDYDGDGKADPTYFSIAPSTFHIAYSGGGILEQTWGLYTTDRPVAGDFDGDGFADLAVYEANGTWHLARTTAGYAGLQLGGAGDIPVARDYDGDGATDMAIFQPHNATWHVSGTQSGYFGLVWGQPGDVPAPADFDGDGMCDIAVFRPSNQTWYIHATQDGDYTVKWGLLPTDQPVPADFDGDGYADIAVYQQNGTWHLARTTAGYAGLRLGGPGDIPVPADYDGDGADDMAIFQPHNATWHVSGTQSGYFGFIWGNPGDTPVR